jgi:hypothetical protein
LNAELDRVVSENQKRCRLRLGPINNPMRAGAPTTEEPPASADTAIGEPAGSATSVSRSAMRLSPGFVEQRHHE